MMPYPFIFIAEDFWRGHGEQKDNYAKLIHQWYTDYHYDYDCVYENTIQ